MEEIKKNKIIKLVNSLNQATIKYDEGAPYISDKQWDDLYFELDQLEKETGIILSNSPTHNVIFETVSELKKVKHNHPMLSLDKTKDINTIKSFIEDKDWIVMAKMDGLTCSLRYVNGELVGAETRGNGEVGEDILHNAKVIPSIPQYIDFKDELIIDGEIICTYKDFEQFDSEYKNPRNFASGSIRLLSSKECRSRHLTFIAWDVIKGIEKDTLGEKLTTLDKLGFTIVPAIRKSMTRDVDDPIPFNGDIGDAIKQIEQSSAIKSYPIDGIVIKYDNIKDYEDAGKTDHHFKGGIAFKFYDEEYPTILRDIEWTMGRTGTLTPVAIYDDVDTGESVLNRASLHNISILHDTLHGRGWKGQKIHVAKINMIIPQIVWAEEDNEDTEKEYILQPLLCPCCGEPVCEQGVASITLVCENPDCVGKLINRLDHFCGKKGLDIKGLSKATLEKLIEWKWLTDIEDIFLLRMHRNDWIKKPGFGIASVDKILNAIEVSRECTTEKFICALGIPLIGKVASKALVNKFGNYTDFRDAVQRNDERLYEIDGIGEVMINSLRNFDYAEADHIFESFIYMIAAVPSTNGTELEGKTFVITGKVTQYKNRDELKSFIESKGGKVTGSVTSKTDYLINNDADSASAKNVTAKRLNIPIINEQQFQLLASAT